MELKYLDPPKPIQKEGDAIIVLEAVLEESVAKKAATAENPNASVYIVATLSSGDEIRVDSARNVGDSTIEITGLKLTTQKHCTIFAGVATVAFEVVVITAPPQSPNLSIVQSDL